jgi:hypothetical protein
MSECPQHGSYIGTAEQCPVCAGRSTGRTWSGNTAAEMERNAARLREADPNGDDPTVMTHRPYAPELDQAWEGRL